MIRKEKTYKFLAIAYNVDPKTVDNRTNRLMKVKAFRSDTADKIAKKRIEKLEKQTGCKWTLHSDPGKISDRQERKHKAIRFIGRAHDYILESVKSDKDIRGEIDNLTQTAEYKSATPPEKILMKVGLLYRKIGNTELLQEAGKLASLASGGKVRFPVKGMSKSDRLYRFANIFPFAVEILGSEYNACKWLLAPHFSFKGKTPMEKLKTDAGAKEVEVILAAIRYGASL